MGKHRTYGVGTSKLLLCGDDGAAALGGVEGGFAFDDGLTGGAAAGAGAGFAADAGHVVPVLVCHFGRDEDAGWRWVMGGGGFGGEAAVRRVVVKVRRGDWWEVVEMESGKEDHRYKN